jgi:hypothetical protein
MLPCCLEAAHLDRKRQGFEEIPATSYLRNNHMAQPATSTPPRNMAKQ